MADVRPVLEQLMAGSKQREDRLMSDLWPMFAEEDRD